jgi:hypothetical protein
VTGMLHLTLHSVSMLAFFQGTQLNLFERFLTQAVSGINSTGITSGMQNVAYVVLLVGFLWQVYQSLLHGGDVRGLGTGLIKYVVTAVVVMNYGSVFTTINQGFVNGGNWVSNASGGNVLQNWGTDLQAQFTQDGTQQLWGLITGSIAGLIDGLLIIVAYLLYPIVVVIFGFFYIFYGKRRKPCARVKTRKREGLRFLRETRRRQLSGNMSRMQGISSAPCISSFTTGRKASRRTGGRGRRR